MKRTPFKQVKQFALVEAPKVAKYFDLDTETNFLQQELTETEKGQGIEYILDLMESNNSKLLHDTLFYFQRIAVKRVAT